MPAVLTIAAVIIFPWLFTLFMSFADWSVTGKITFVGLENYVTLFADERFRGAVVTTLLFTSAAVFFPIILGTLAALVFNEKFAGRGLFRALFIMPMMATPVAVACSTPSATTRRPRVCAMSTTARTTDRSTSYCG